MKLATAEQMRELDRQAIEDMGIPSIDLMERAAEGVAAAVLTLLLIGALIFRANSHKGGRYSG